MLLAEWIRPQSLLEQFHFGMDRRSAAQVTFSRNLPRTSCASGLFRSVDQRYELHKTGVLGPTDSDRLSEWSSSIVKEHIAVVLLHKA